MVRLHHRRRLLYRGRQRRHAGVTAAGGVVLERRLGRESGRNRLHHPGHRRGPLLLPVVQRLDLGAARFARGNRRRERHPGFRLRFLHKHRLRLFLQRERQQLRLYRFRPLQRVDGRENLPRGAGARCLHLRFRQ